MLHTFLSLLFIIFHKLCHFAVERIDCIWKRSVYNCIIQTVNDDNILDFHMNVSHCRFLPCIIYWPLLMFALLFDTFFVGIFFFLFFVCGAFCLVHHANALDFCTVWPQEMCTLRETIDGKTGKCFAKFMVKTRASKNIEELAKTTTAVNLSVYTDALKHCSQLEHEW